MIMDELLEFCDNVSCANAAGLDLLGDVIDLGASGDNPGAGEPIYLVIKTGLTEIITGGTAGTISFKLSSDSVAAIAADGTETDHIITPDFVTDDANANDSELNAGGTIFIGALPSNGTYERFLGIISNIGTTTVTAGTIDAFLCKDPAAWVAKADAVN